MTRRFDVAFSLAGQQRSLIEPVAKELEQRGRTVFFYGWPQFEAELAVPKLHRHLRQIYTREAHLIVPVLSADYADSSWAGGAELTVVEELIFDGYTSIMPLRVDDTRIDGLSKLDGFLDVRGRSPSEIADRIDRRLTWEGLTPELGGRGEARVASAGALAVPPLPRWVVERTLEVTRIREALASSVHDPAAPAVAVVGMAGIGKTTLLKMVARPDDCPAEFEDFVWVAAGREVRDPIELVREAAIALCARKDDAQEHAAVTVKRLRELLQRRRVLIAIDDVWRKEQVEPFLIGGSTSRVIFTARERAVGIGLGVIEVRVDTLEVDQAVRLLRSWAGREIDGVADVARRLGFHPLALRLAGIQLQVPTLSPAAWLAQFDRLSGLKHGPATQDRNENIVACFALSLERFSQAHQELYFSLGIFPFQIAVPQETIARFWGQLGWERDQVRETLRDFELSGLLDVSAKGISVHDLLRQYARDQLGDSWSTLHSRLLQAYGATSDQAMPAAADGYYQAFSSYHLREAGVKQGGGAKFSPADSLGWLSSIFSWRSRLRPLPRPPSVTPEPLPETARVALMGSWGTGLYGAPVIAQSILASAPYDLVLHLGDIYRSGTVNEVRTQFLRFWPTAAARVSRAMNGNHEMYSGGIGYFDYILPEFKQTSSYFSFANTYWVLICLDSAYVDADLGPEQRTWLRETIAEAGTRKILMFSHHYLYSPFEVALPRFRAAIADALPRSAMAWYWAHEHECIVFDASAQNGGLRARCMGHGGFPNIRRRPVRRLPSESVHGEVKWKRFPASDDHPSGLILDGPNPYLVGREDKYSPQGFATLEFNGPTLVERVHLADGSEIWTNRLDATLP